MLQGYEPDDFVIATNEAHSVREFAEKAFRLVGLDYEDHVRVDQKYFRPLDVSYLQGDYTKARERLGWRPRMTFDGLLEVMVREEIRRWRMWLDGDRFPWDAASYPGEETIVARSQRKG
jgi:GDPmannose 4,6-dehydratase